MTVRTRFAPSPTGSLHVGGARTALYNFLLAKRLGGEFILRIEDTDHARNTRQSQQQLLDELTWLGLQWDEGIDQHTHASFGQFGPYQQSQRQEIYTQYVNQLLQNGQAFYCFADTDTLTAHREANADSPQVHFVSPDREQTLSQAQARLAAGEAAVVRFRNDYANENFILNDLVRGEITLPGHMIGDFIIQRADGSHVYNFCCAIDDCLMKITHVLRGEEHLPNSLRQLMLIRALSFCAPQYGHLSLIMGEGNKKLSKRDGAASISDFQSAGYTREGLINYLALLGWSDPEHREILSLDMLIQAFDTTRLHAAAPQFDAQKLRWINHQQLQLYTPEALKNACEPFLQSLEILPPRSDAWLEQTLPLFQQDLHTLTDCTPIFAKLSDAHARLTPSATEILQWPHVHALLHDWLAFLFQTLSDADTQTISFADIDPVLAQYCTQSTCTQAIQQLYQPNDPSRIPDKLYALIDRIYKKYRFSTRTSAIHLCAESFSAAAKALQNTSGQGETAFHAPPRCHHWPQ